MKFKTDFREFYYLDEGIVNNLLGHIEGFVQDEHSEMDRLEKNNQGKVNVVGLGNVGKDLKTTNEVLKKGRISAELKYKRLFEYMKSEGLETIDVLDDHLWVLMIQEDEYFEIKGSFDFTQIYNVSKSAEFYGGLLKIFDQQREKEVETITTQANKLRDIQERNGIPIKFKIVDGGYTFIAYLNERFLLKEQNEVVGNNYKMLCKIERVIPKNQKYNLFDVKEVEKQLLNREQRRQKQTLPPEFLETVTGPAAIVMPIAIYR
ncbi:DUF6414 family protein [Bacillus subtilis]|uniref:DUF6414 family protein n=1 Tax=Bacillus subtilis TaxID=1423 RepID=UPI001267C64B|nr:hypothetical protein [Bacillus subtilis]MED1678677.1 hypothetical protein [Bacillus subtilis]